MRVDERALDFDEREAGRYEGEPEAPECPNAAALLAAAEAGDDWPEERAGCAEVARQAIAEGRDIPAADLEGYTQSFGVGEKKRGRVRTMKATAKALRRLEVLSRHAAGERPAAIARDVGMRLGSVQAIIARGARKAGGDRVRAAEAARDAAQVGDTIRRLMSPADMGVTIEGLHRELSAWCKRMGRRAPSFASLGDWLSGARSPRPHGPVRHLLAFARERARGKA